MHVTSSELELPVFIDRTARETAAPPAARVKRDTLPGTAVSVRRLGKSYGGRPVLDGVQLDIAPGEFVAIVGRSGCGKSTLLRLLAGLEGADTGAVSLDGQALAPGNRHDGTRIMFQDARLLPWKRVLDNIALGLPGREGRERAREALAQVGLADRADEWPAVLSGGQRQRVALARALVHRPHLLLLDEPLGALDALTRIEMQQLIERLWREHGFTAVLVTHDVAEAVALADRVLLVESHQIALDERIALPRPRSRGTAAFAATEERILQRVLQQPAPPERPDAQWLPAHERPASGLRFAV
ncbi:ATP-binding cassette domain-containing protein [Caldimonas brevitalea]|uniref:Sulfonate transport system ATP-binding protein n=1 Tax=Caldimonas brevitalea TaxID=413882 RepID=A0A0G3BXQ5_9BURK|nr:ATP-binding cassette domain-containing protein [Caldimonas brevitalea]AKJ31275.1 sulfonate transport system ATP-binding protein [Caldimonas brevitalea]